jgi:hypothetical protein
VHAGVIGNAENRTATHTRIGHGEDGVSHDIQANVLAAGHGATATDRGTDHSLGCDLLVGRPLDEHLVSGIGSHAFGNFGTGSTGIRGNHMYAGFICALRDGSVSQQQFFHENDPFAVKSWKPSHVGRASLQQDKLKLLYHTAFKMSIKIWINLRSRAYFFALPVHIFPFSPMNLSNSPSNG